MDTLLNTWNQAKHNLNKLNKVSEKLSVTYKQSDFVSNIRKKDQFDGSFRTWIFRNCGFTLGARNSGNRLPGSSKLLFLKYSTNCIIVCNLFLKGCLWTALFYAHAKGHMNTVKLLEEYGASKEHLDKAIA